MNIKHVIGKNSTCTGPGFHRVTCRLGRKSTPTTRDQILVQLPIVILYLPVSSLEYY